MASAKRQAAQPLGERIATLEATVPNLAEVMKKGFEDLGIQLKELNGQVQIIVQAEAGRTGAEKERKRTEHKQLAYFGLGAGTLGGLVDAAINYFRH